MLRRSDFIAATYALSFVFANFGIAIAARIPMMTTTIRSSMSVKPFLLFFMLRGPVLVNRGGPPIVLGVGVALSGGLSARHFLGTISLASFAISSSTRFTQMTRNYALRNNATTAFFRFSQEKPGDRISCASAVAHE